MKVQLDTHCFLWYIWDDARLPERVVQAIEDPANTIFVSIVSLWEIALKSSLGKLTIAVRLEDFFARNVDGNGFQVLPVTRAHLIRLHDLPFHHRDPFDRLLIAQCLAEGMTFASGDGQFAAYPVSLLWE